jgi:glc operon protein GlcG
MDIQYQQAKALVDAAIAIATEGKLAVSVAVADSHGELVAFGRMDNAPFHTGVLAPAKAYTSARDRQSTANLGQWARDTGKDMGYWADAKITGMGGGLPITVNNQIIGGMGVSGLSEEEDEQLVQQALARVGI